MLKHPHDVIKNAAHCGVTLTVPTDKDVLIASPPQRVTEELAEGIRAHKDAVMRYTLYRQAIVWLSQRCPADLNVAALAASQRELNEAWGEDFLSFRLALRDFAKQAVREGKRLEASRG